MVASGNSSWCNLPEPCDEKSEAHKAGYRTIADIGRERIRRAAKKIKADNPKYQGDVGFKSFTLAPSNFKVWESDVKKHHRFRTTAS